MIKPKPDQITKWIKKHFGDDYKTAKHGREIRINNPLSIDDGYHLWINIYKAIVNDFRPRYKNLVSGSFLSFVMKYKNITFREAAEEVIGSVDYKDYNYDSNNISESSTSKTIIKLPEDFIKLTYEDDVISPIIKRYLNQRCISNGKIYTSGLGYSGLNVVFPYYEFNQIVYWQQRSITNKEFRFPLDSNKADFIYGFDNIDSTEPVIITESIFNSLMFDNAVAIGGSDLSDMQKNKLRRLKPKKLIMALDNDDAGKVGTSKAYEKLNTYFDMYYSLPPSQDEDWNDIAKNGQKEDAMKWLKKGLAKLDYAASIKLRL
jgi:hypothetical protein